jgi:hypothetical protein
MTVSRMRRLCVDADRRLVHEHDRGPMEQTNGDSRRRASE